MSGAQEDGIPSVVIEVMMLKKVDTFPLTVIDGNPVISGRFPTKEELEDFFINGVKEPMILVNRADSAVDFPTKSRLHISLDVSNLSESLRFYRVLFNQEPIKLRSDYAKFELEDTPLVITLNEFGRKPGKDGPVNHFGIQVKSSDDVLMAKQRCLEAGFTLEEEVATACCYAVQTKIWAVDPDGTKWEVYVVTEADVDAGCGPDCICWVELQPSLTV
ncbi:ArsI/CadI family heavy metal resistance metalloenzyme [Niallia sp. Krafla_26]|uniref:ArsI/CadI family heavy metal resistance metalloenzyme n=1 Tax=Niallia sp. Krafla_26 TaxID=3064703 RepID=UPI003D183805